MFGTLLESKSRRESQYRYTIASVVAHAALISGAAVATAWREPAPPTPPVVAEPVVFVPIDRAPAPTPITGDPAAPEGDGPRVPAIPAPTGIAIDPRRIPDFIPPVGAALGDVLSRAHEELTRRTGGSTGSGNAGGTVPHAGGAYTLAHVDRTAALQTVVEPPYPPMARAAGIEGRVLMQFVVDSTGRVDLASVRVRESASEQFTASVRAILPRLRFTPARLGGRPVAQLVEMPFEFRLER